MGALLPSRRFLFAEETTRDGFIEWLSVQNPSDEAVSVTPTFMDQDGSVTK